MKTRFALTIALTLAIALGLILSGCGSAATPTPTSAPAAPTATKAAAVAATPASATPVSTPVAKAAFPVALKDDTGRSVTIEKAPTRIVSLAPSNTEILFALGLGAQVVGVTDFCDYPAEAKTKTKIGGLDASLEKIVATQPDLVLAVRETAGITEIGLKLQELKVPVLVIGPKDIDGILASINLIGLATGKSAEAAKVVADMKAKMDAVTTKVKAATTKPRVMYEIDATDPGKPFVPGPGSFMDHLIVLAGGTNIAADAKMEWAQLSLEEIVKKDPEIIFLGDANYGVTANVVKARPGWSGIAAVKNGKIEAVDDNLISRPGPRIADGLVTLAKLIHPSLFQ